MIGYIITGTRRGLGKALAIEALSRDDWVFALSRKPDFSEKKYVNLLCDLSRTDLLIDKLETLFSKIPIEALTAMVLINNAGVLAPIKKMADARTDQIQNNINVNLTAPAILIAGFLKLTQNLNFSRRIINISSGAAKNAYAGWGPYCSTKAGLNMLTKCVALEQGDHAGAVKICSVAPGVLDTGMQEQIRQALPEDFPKQERFIQLKQQGDLLAPSLVAKILLEFDRQGALAQGGIYDIREMLGKRIK